jgi:hypothetical protein
VADRRTAWTGSGQPIMVGCCSAMLYADLTRTVEILGDSLARGVEAEDSEGAPDAPMHALDFRLRAAYLEQSQQQDGLAAKTSNGHSAWFFEEFQPVCPSV